MPVQVSVIVPVLDAGPGTHAGVQTLLRQTMPQTRLEILLVRAGEPGGDDPGWLTAVARDQPHVRIVWRDQHQTLAGLRNAGLDEARGAYVLVLEPYQRLTADALRRMFALGQRNQADIVLGRVASAHRQTLPPGVRRARDVSASDPLAWTSLRPFALYRRAFVNQHAIREPAEQPEPPAHTREVVSVHALLVADVISAAAESIHCHELPAATEDLDATTWSGPSQYAIHLRELIDLIGRFARSPDVRQVALRRLYRDHVLPQAQAGHELCAHVSKLATDQVFDAVHDELLLVERLSSTLVRAGRFAELVELNQRVNRVTGDGHLTDARWKNGQLRVTVAGSLRHTGAGGMAVGLRRRGGRDFADPALLPGTIDTQDTEITRELRRYRAEVVVHHPATGASWATPANLDLVVEHADVSADADGTPCTLSFHGTATLDPERLAGRGPLGPGSWEVRLVLEAFGLRRAVPLRAEHPRTMAEHLRPAVLGKPAQVVVPSLSPDGSLLVDVGRQTTTLGTALRGRPVQPQPGNGQRLDLLLPMVSQPGSGNLDAELALRGTDEHSSSIVLPARLAPYGSQVRLFASVEDAPGPVRDIRPGTWQLLARLDGEAGPEIEVGAVHVDPRSRVYLVGADRIGPVADLSRRILATAVSRPGLRRVGVRVVDRLPDGWRRRIRRAVHRARS